MKRNATILCIIGIGVLMLAAMADVPTALGSGTGFRIIKGEGSICAAGVGMIQFHGSGELIVKIDVGQLILNNESAVLEIQGKGIKRQLANGWVLYEGFNGTARLNGEDLFCQLAGRGLRVGARGEGVMLLMGKGAYRTPCDKPGVSSSPYTQDGIGIELGTYILDSDPLPGT